MKRRNIGNLTNELARLPSLDRAELVEYWRHVYQCDPPFNMSRPLMLRAIAYQMQVVALGGLKPSTRRYLAAIANGGEAKSVSSLKQIKTGTRLLREWHGVTHEVLVLEEGVQYQGKLYRSLSQVAKLITGAKWSGPLFFGLKQETA